MELLDAGACMVPWSWEGWMRMGILLIIKKVNNYERGENG
jgi:hypothetical protein